MDKKEIITFIKLNWKIFLVIGMMILILLIGVLFLLLSREEIKPVDGTAEISNDNLKDNSNDNSFNSMTNYTQTINSEDTKANQGFKVVSISENIYYTPSSGNVTNHTYNIIYFTSPVNTGPASNTNSPSQSTWGDGSTDDNSGSTSGSAPGFPTANVIWEKVLNIF